MSGRGRGQQDDFQCVEISIPLSSKVDDGKVELVYHLRKPNENKINDKLISEGPKDIKRAFDGRVDNLSLILNKVLPVPQELKVLVERREYSKAEDKLRDSLKRVWLSIAELHSFSNLEREVTKSRVNIFKELKRDGYRVLHFTLTTTSSLIVGLGSAHAFETAITLHHVFGVPYIPGSALKGVVRAAAFWKLAEELGLSSEADLRKLYDDFYRAELFKEGSKRGDKFYAYKLLFGAQNFKGLLTFLDSYLDLEGLGSPFRLDIMNPHYSKYYQGSEPPADYLDPTPIPFLTLKKGVKFEVVALFDSFRWERRVKPWLESQNKPVYLSTDKLEDVLRELLGKAFSHLGLGAKTRLGYGLGEVSSGEVVT